MHTHASLEVRGIDKHLIFRKITDVTNVAVAFQ